MLKSGKQIKRNEVSLISTNGRRRATLQLLTIIAAILSTNLSVVGISLAANLKIQQENYLYKIPSVQTISTETFVISSTAKQNQKKKTVTRKNNSSASPLRNKLIVHFPINSAEIVSEERLKLFALLNKFEFSPNTPLAITGFTCEKGPAKFNMWLSEQRAKNVAKLLDKKGYSIAHISGKGASNFISNNYSPLNRRVEVSPVQSKSAQTGQSQFSSKEEAL